MASCPHCRASLVEPAVFCGVCGGRVGASAGPDDPAATRQLDGPAAATQPMQAAPPPSASASHPAAPASPPATTSDRPGDSLMRVVRPSWIGPARIGFAVLGILALGWLGSRALRGSSTGSSEPAPTAVALAEIDLGDEDPASATSLRAGPRRVGRASARAASSVLIPQPAGGTTVAPLEQVQAGEPAATTAPAVPAAPTAAPPVSPTGTSAPAALPAAEAPRDAGGSGTLSKDELEAAARYMKGEETVPPSAEDLADRDQAEGYAGNIRMVVKAHAAQVSACYERAFKIDAPARAARVEIGFHVDKAGMPGNVRTVSNTSGSDALANCLAQRVGGWRFPRPPSGEFEAVYPFTFSGAR